MDITSRSPCEYKVGALIHDKKGVVAVGWNNAWHGLGIHAEAHAVMRSNRARLRGATITIAGRRCGWIYSRPCEACQALIDKWGLNVEFYDGQQWMIG